MGSPGGPGIHVGVSEQFLWCRSRYCHAGGEQCHRCRCHGGCALSAMIVGQMACVN